MVLAPWPDKQIGHIPAVVSGFLRTTNFLCASIMPISLITDGALMVVIHNFTFRSIPFQIHTELYLFFKKIDKMAAGGHFGCPQITFDRISGHFRSIRNFFLSNSSEIFG